MPKLPGEVHKDRGSYYSQFRKAKTVPVLPVSTEGECHRYKAAVICAYRDTPAQNRREQLSTFVPFITHFLERLGGNFEFCIIVVEQSCDGRKFNRGRLLNTGFQIAKARGCDYCIFHDIDLLPDNDLLEYYGYYPRSPLHLAAVWTKYEHLGLFFGGVNSMTVEHFEALNGFPNNFWGWGGEDEELYHRIVDNEMMILRPARGSYMELEHPHARTLENSVNEIKALLIAERNGNTWRNGVANLKTPETIEVQALNDRTIKYVVSL